MQTQTTKKVQKSTTQGMKPQETTHVRESTNNQKTGKEMCGGQVIILNDCDSPPNNEREIQLLEQVIALFKNSNQKIHSLEESINELRLLKEPNSKVHSLESNYGLHSFEKSNSKLPYTFIAGLFFIMMMCGLMIIYVNNKVHSLEDTVRKELYDEVKEQVLIDLAPKVITSGGKTHLNQLANNFKQEGIINNIIKNNNNSVTRSNTLKTQLSTMQLKRLADDFQQEEVLNMIKNNNSSTTESESNATNNTVIDELRSKETSKITIINSRELFLYKKSNNESKIITTIPEKSKITFLKEKDDGWLKVEFDGHIGYISYVYTNYTVKLKKQLLTIKTYKNYKMGYIDAVNVNLRKKPNTVSTILNNLSHTNVIVHAQTKFFKNEPYGWYEVTDLITNETAYVYGEFVKLIKTNSKKTTNTQKETSTITEKEINNETSSQSTNTKSNTTNSQKETNSEETSSKDASSKKTSSKSTSSKDTSSKKTSSKNTSSKDTSSKNTSFIEATEENIKLLALVLTQEAGGCGKAEMRRVGQVLLNRANIKKMSLVALLSEPLQYPTTWAYIQAGKVTPTEEALEVAKELLNGKNGFEGTDVPESLWNYVYFQGCNDGIEVFTSKWHRYAIRDCDAYLLTK